MPYETRWVPAPQNMTLPVHAELPIDFIERHALYGYRMAEARQPFRQMYFCRHCGGWVEGTPNDYREDTLAPLSGRRGRASHCLRCGEEIAFSGVVS